RSSSRKASETRSPQWTIRSAPASRSTHADGSARAPRGRWVSEMTAIRTGPPMLPDLVVPVLQMPRLRPGLRLRLGLGLRLRLHARLRSRGREEARRAGRADAV